MKGYRWWCVWLCAVPLGGFVLAALLYALSGEWDQAFQCVLKASGPGFAIAWLVTMNAAEVALAKVDALTGMNQRQVDIIDTMARENDRLRRAEAS